MRFILLVLSFLKPLRFVQSNRESRYQFIHPESLSASELRLVALVYDLNGPVVVSTDGGEVSAQECLLPVNVHPVLSILVPQVSLCTPDKLFAVIIENNEMVRWR